MGDAEADHAGAGPAGYYVAWRRSTACALVLLLLLHQARARADTLLPTAGGLVGAEFNYIVKPGDSLNSISSRYGVAAALIASANGIKRRSEPHPGRLLRIDNRHIVPRSPSRGILINIPQRMLFFFTGGRLLGYYPVGLGRPSWPTPVGSFTVVRMRANPTWIAPESIRREAARAGKELQTCVPPGPDNPLGRYALDLSIPGYRIHGTIAPSSVYHFRTHGCVRLHPDDIEALYKQVTVGEPGEIIYQPVLLAALPDGRIFLEVNRDVYKKGAEPSQLVRELAEVGNLEEETDWNLVRAVVKNADGIAHEIDNQNTRAAHNKR